MNNELIQLEDQINSILVNYGIVHHYSCYDVKMSETFLESISGDKVKTIWADKFGNICMSYHSWYKLPIDDSTNSEE